MFLRLIQRTFLLALATCTLVFPAHADTASEINQGVSAAIKQFSSEVSGGARYLKNAVGMLVFPSVIKGGLGIGGEYGEGALRIGGKNVQYYSTASASIGLQFGIQKKSLIVVFKTKDALRKFRASDGWKAGVDGSVALVKWGAGEDINTIEESEPVVGFIFGNEGFMYNLTFEGSKFSKIDR